MKGLKRELVRLLRELRDPYRPELHYMRGPGPRTLDKRRGPQRADGTAGSTSARADLPLAPAGGLRSA